MASTSCKPHLSAPTKLRILEEIKAIGYKPTEVLRNLRCRGYKLSKSSVIRVHQRYLESGDISRRPTPGRPSKIKNPALLSFVQDAMDANDETTGKELKEQLTEMGCAEDLSERSLRRARQLLGWDYTRTGYCQAIRAGNVSKRMEWALRAVDLVKEGYRFKDLVFVDETKIQLERHAKKSCRRKGFRIKKKPVHKHPVSVLVWAGISRKGRTICKIFKGIMCADDYISILEECLLPFTNSAYGPGNWKLVQDNGKELISNSV